MFVFTFGPLHFWHGLNGWSSRYLLPLIPFLLIPLSFSFQTRGTPFKIILVILGIVGFFINLIYLLQDTHWFVWGFMGDDSRGLYSLGRRDDGSVFPIWINPLVIWSFEYNQLTQSVLWAFNKLQLDIFLLKILGIYGYVTTLSSILALSVFVLLKTLSLKNKPISNSSK